MYPGDNDLIKGQRVWRYAQLLAFLANAVDNARNNNIILLY